MQNKDSQFDLSIVIVNYNVCSFLEQCLASVQKAISHLNVEIFVVDNNSVDGSVEMVKAKFPQVFCIDNKENVGFAKANNQAIRLAKGRYILLLNPDTVVEADTFDLCVAFMEETKDAGALGVKMLDGKGRFLPESKRGLPTPEVSFYKISGLSKLFPYSKRLGKYHLSYLDKDQIHSVDILSGAFMLLRTSVLEKIGLLDESFFMYGEDVDLSYRVLLGGYQNYYFPKTRIIHYKGESTKKGSLNYVIVFYRAMQIFAEKYFSKKNTCLFSWFIKIAIWARASLSIFQRIFTKIAFPVFDFVLSYGILVLLQYVWSRFYFQNVEHFPQIYTHWILPIYALIWIVALWVGKAYTKPIHVWRIVYGFVGGSVCILLAHALLGAEWHFSRFIIIVGSVLSLGVLLTYRCIGSCFFKTKFAFYSKKHKKYLILGDSQEVERVSSLLVQKGVDLCNIYNIKLNSPLELSYLMLEIVEMERLYKIDEFLFCAKI
ncbi:MAG: glycosyltransferase [Bacteroidales bacterium]